MNRADNRRALVDAFLMAHLDGSIADAANLADRVLDELQPAQNALLTVTDRALRMRTLGAIESREAATGEASLVARLARVLQGTDAELLRALAEELDSLGEEVAARALWLAAGEQLSSPAAGVDSPDRVLGDAEAELVRGAVLWAGENSPCVDDPRTFSARYGTDRAHLQAACDRIDALLSGAGEPVTALAVAHAATEVCGPGSGGKVVLSCLDAYDEDVTDADLAVLHEADRASLTRLRALFAALSGTRSLG